MRYFMYSPLDMSEDEAFNQVEEVLEDGFIIKLISTGYYEYFEIEIGKVPRAHPNYYLVRVEPDGYRRVVHQNLT